MIRWFFCLLLLATMALPAAHGQVDPNSITYPSISSSTIADPIGDFPIPGHSGMLRRGMSAEQVREILSGSELNLVDRGDAPNTAWLEGVLQNGESPMAIEVELENDELSSVTFTIANVMLTDWYSTLLSRLNTARIRRTHMLVSGSERDFQATPEVELSISRLDSTIGDGVVELYNYTVNFYNEDEWQSMESDLAAPPRSVTLPGTTSALSAGMSIDQVRSLLAPLDIAANGEITTVAAMKAYQTGVTLAEGSFTLNLFTIEGRLWRVMLVAESELPTLGEWFGGQFSGLPESEVMKSVGISEFGPESETWLTATAMLTRAIVPDPDGKPLYIHVMDFTSF